jgi:hypothetical protein
LQKHARSKYAVFAPLLRAGFCKHARSKCAVFAPLLRAGFCNFFANHFPFGIDRFVERINSPETDFQQIEKVAWVDDFEEKLPKRLPLAFHSLIICYSFNTFDFNGLSFFANNLTDENLSVIVFKDQIVSGITLQNGFVQFARPDDGSYDPICFDTKISRSKREFPVVRIDHEAILCRNEIRIGEKISDSFLKFVLEKAKDP